MGASDMVGENTIHRRGRDAGRRIVDGCDDAQVDLQRDHEWPGRLSQRQRQRENDSSDGKRYADEMGADTDNRLGGAFVSDVSGVCGASNGVAADGGGNAAAGFFVFGHVVSSRIIL